MSRAFSASTCSTMTSRTWARRFSSWEAVAGSYPRFLERCFALSMASSRVLYMLFAPASCQERRGAIEQQRHAARGDVLGLAAVVREVGAAVRQSGLEAGG